MAVSAVYICNLGLRIIGERDIVSLTENNKQARHCSQFYEQAIHVATSLGPWNFAMTKKALTQDGSYTDLFEQYDYAYAKPNEMVRPYKLKSGMDYQLEGEVFLTNDSEAVLKFTQIILDQTKYPRMFVEALSYALAAKLATPLASKRNPTDLLARAVYITNEAMVIDGDHEEITSQEGRHTEDNDSWLSARL